MIIFHSYLTSLDFPIPPFLHSILYSPAKIYMTTLAFFGIGRFVTPPWMIFNLGMSQCHRPTVTGEVNIAPAVFLVMTTGDGLWLWMATT